MKLNFLRTENNTNNENTANNPETQNYAEHKKLSLKIASYNISGVFGIVFSGVWWILNGSDQIFFAVICIILSVFNLVRAKKTKKKLAALDPLSDEEAQTLKAEVNSKIKKDLIKSAIAIVILLLVMNLLDGSSSSSPSDGPTGEPWRDLGVSKKEYMEAYYKIKYGV